MCVFTIALIDLSVALPFRHHMMNRLVAALCGGNLWFGLGSGVISWAAAWGEPRGSRVHFWVTALWIPSAVLVAAAASTLPNLRRNRLRSIVTAHEVRARPSE